MSQIIPWTNILCSYMAISRKRFINKLDQKALISIHRWEMYLLTNDGSQGERVEFCKHDGIGRSISLKDLSKQEVHCHLVKLTSETCKFYLWSPHSTICISSKYKVLKPLQDFNHKIVSFPCFFTNHHFWLLWPQEVTQKSLAQGSAESPCFLERQSQSAAGSLFQVPCQGPMGAPTKPSVPGHLPSPRYLVGKELLQSLPAQPSRLKLLASLISRLPFHQGLGLSKEVGQKDLAGTNKHKLTFA